MKFQQLIKGRSDQLKAAINHRSTATTISSANPRLKERIAEKHEKVALNESTLSLAMEMNCSPSSACAGRQAVKLCQQSSVEADNGEVEMGGYFDFFFDARTLTQDYEASFQAISATRLTDRVQRFPCRTITE